ERIGGVGSGIGDRRSRIDARIGGAGIGSRVASGIGSRIDAGVGRSRCGIVFSANRGETTETHRDESHGNISSLHRCTPKVEELSARIHVRYWSRAWPTGVTRSHAQPFG